jgi:hypothetical protein
MARYLRRGTLAILRVERVAQTVADKIETEQSAGQEDRGE